MTAFANPERLQAVLPSLEPHGVKLPHEIFTDVAAPSHELVPHQASIEVVSGTVVAETVDEEPETPETPEAVVDRINRSIESAREKHRVLDDSVRSAYNELYQPKERLRDITKTLTTLSGQRRTQEALVVTLDGQISEETENKQVFENRVAALDAEIDPLEAEKQRTKLTRERTEAFIAQHVAHPGSVDLDEAQLAAIEIEEPGGAGGFLRRKIESLQQEIAPLAERRAHLCGIDIPESKQKITDLEASKKAAEAKIADLTRRIDSLTVESAELELRIHEVVAAYDRAIIWLDAVQDRRHQPTRQNNGQTGTQE